MSNCSKRTCDDVGGPGTVPVSKEDDMPTNKIIEKMRRGERALGLDLSFYTDELIELAGLMGLDYVHYDGQHAPITPETIDRFCRICDGYGLTPSMRVPDHQPGNILNYLDRGIRSITVPITESKEQAEALVKHCFFAPVGLRSFTGQRILRYGLGGDFKTVMEDTNTSFLLIPQLETITAYNNLDEILTVDGIEVFAGGPNDLAQSMGHVGEPNHPDCLRVTADGEAKIHAAGKKLSSEVMLGLNTTGSIQADIAAFLKENGR
jgi:4-hydroxy-2-oxoheptanedioate aldolase